MRTCFSGPSSSTSCACLRFDISVRVELSLLNLRGYVYQWKVLGYEGMGETAGFRPGTVPDLSGEASCVGGMGHRTAMLTP
jgi:hypothetical protein